MTEPEDRTARHYRALPREEPPREIDSAILAAGRRAVGARPGKLSRWAAPVSIAAVLVLGIGVSLRMKQEQPGIETSAPQSEYAMPAAEDPVPSPAQATAPTPKQPAPQALSGDGKARERSLQAAPDAPTKPSPGAPSRREKREAAAPAPTPAAPAASATAPAPPAAADAANAATSAARRDPNPELSRRAPAEAGAAAPAARAFGQAREKSKADPERELERIAALRAEGRDAEADRALEAFRREHPDFRIPDATWQRVRPR